MATNLKPEVQKIEDFDLHYCQTLYKKSSRKAFCKFCGIQMDLNNPFNLYHRSSKFQNKMCPADPNQTYLLMFKNQSVNRVYNETPPHLEFRSQLIDYVTELATKFDYKHKTRHLSIAILDQVFSQCKISNDDIVLVALVSFLLSAKMEEHDNNIPELDDIVLKLNGQYTKQQFLQCERTIYSQILGYNVNIITTYHFVQEFLYRGILTSQDIGQGVVDNKLSCELINFFEDLVEVFLEFSLRHYQFYKYTAATVAVSAIACARKIFGAQQIWTRNLEQLSFYKWESVEGCADEMIRLFVINEQHVLQKLYKKRNIFQQIIKSMYSPDSKQFENQNFLQRIDSFSDQDFFLCNQENSQNYFKENGQQDSTVSSIKRSISLNKKQQLQLEQHKREENENNSEEISQILFKNENCVKDYF